MSTATTLAELEAAIAEHDRADELSDEQREAVKLAVQDGTELDEAIAAILDPPPKRPAAAPAAAATEPTKQQIAQLDKENARHRDRVFEVMGSFMEGFEPCKECGTLGYTPPGPRPRTHENFRRCPTCNGYGQVLTGSLAQGHETADCPDCGGWGFQTRTDVAAPAIAATVPPAPAAPQPEFGVPTWMGDPRIGTPGA